MTIIWLASYPKSGNTWLRAILTNYLNQDKQPASINELIGGSGAVSRHEFDELLGLESSDLRPDESEQYRPLFYKLLASECTPPPFYQDT